MTWSTWLRPSVVSAARTLGGIFSASAGLALASALLSKTPTSGTDTITLRPPSEKRLAWAARADERTSARKLDDETVPCAVDRMNGRKAVRSGFSSSSIPVTRSATNAATRGSARLVDRRSAKLSGKKNPRRATLSTAAMLIVSMPRLISRSATTSLRLGIIQECAWYAHLRAGLRLRRSARTS